MTSIVSLLILIFFGLAPSFIWLLFFLRKDSHPESNRMIIKIFFYGMLITFPAALIEMGISASLIELNFSPIFISLLYWFIGVALIEEGLKYLVIREKVIRSPEFDEPVDAMLYMIIAALGFAALENILVLLPLLGEPFFETMFISIYRFIGATFLHALCSATVGYFLALSFFETKKRFWLITTGLTIATLLHGIYNLSIIKAGEAVEQTAQGLYFILIPIIILIGLAFFVSFGFRKLKKTVSVCKIKI